MQLGKVENIKLGTMKSTYGMGKYGMDFHDSINADYYYCIERFTHEK